MLLKIYPIEFASIIIDWLDRTVTSHLYRQW